MNPSKWFEGIGPNGFRRVMNLAPGIRASGCRIVRISDDWLEWDLQLRRRLRNLNYMGTLFGGALYSSMDPHFVLAFVHILGPDYVVWDKAARVRFLRPGRTKLHGKIRIEAAEADAIKTALETERSIERTYTFQWVDDNGEVVFEADKILYFRRRST